jgi:predicted amidohydrolase
MPRTIKIAAAQMDANPAPTQQRLERAEALAAQAALAGAQIVVLPELFNTGYAYSNENYHRAESFSGPTVAWMKSTSSHLNIYLAGALMLLGEDEILDSLLLCDPDGRMWRYDKNFPWGWERAYFQAGHGGAIAQTSLGDIGMLICWDIAHAKLWQYYAGKVDLILVSSCPPDVSNPTYHFSNSKQVKASQLGPIMDKMMNVVQKTFIDNLQQQSAWLRVPVANTVGCGQIRTAIPRGLASMLMLLPSSPGLIRYLPLANQIQISCAFPSACRILDSHGQALAVLAQEQGETFALAEVVLPDYKPTPWGKQPKPPLPWIAYFFSDVYLPWLMVSIYRRRK